MASVTTRLGARKKTKEVQKNHAETEKLVHEPQKGDIEEESTINALRLEIENLKRKLSAKEETIDELDRERDEIYKEHYDLRVALADAWKIRLATDSDNVKEVAKLLILKKGFGSKTTRQTYTPTRSEDVRKSANIRKHGINHCSSRYRHNSKQDCRDIEDTIARSS